MTAPAAAALSCAVTANRAEESSRSRSPQAALGRLRFRRNRVHGAAGGASVVGEAADKAVSRESGHRDSFARDRLPPPEHWPDLECRGARLDRPVRLNAVSLLLDRWIAEGRGERPCLISGGSVWSYARLQETVDRIARVLVERHGLVPGGRVLLRGPNTPMLAACWLAVVKAGGIAVATMPLLRTPELAAIVDQVRIGLALCDARYATELAAAGVPALLTFNGGGDGSANDPAAGELERVIATAEPGFVSADTAADDIAIIAFTSGTTGRPKATAHFHRDLLAVADLSPRSILDTSADDVFCGTASLAFAYGLGGLLLFPLRVGAATVLLERPSAEGVLQAIAQHGATRLFTVPTMYRGMLAVLDRQPAAAAGLGGLRSCVSAGEPLPPATFEAWQAVSGCPILDSLGTTELLNAVLHADPRDLRPGATGKPVPGYEAMVVDEGFRPLPAGQSGRLAVRGPTGCRYLDDERQAGYVRDGWNLTGDAGRIDEDGFFWYHARTDDLIVSGGYKISGTEVEDVLLRHEIVEECAVIAAPDPLRGTIPKAYVVIRDGIEATEETARLLQDFVKERIAPYKYPRAVAFLERLPRTETGKIQRYKLRALAARSDEG